MKKVLEIKITGIKIKIIALLNLILLTHEPNRKDTPIITSKGTIEYRKVKFFIGIIS
jgi:hypothetical protein